MIKFTDNFLKESKKLSKKFKLLKNDLKNAIKEIEVGNFGTYLGYDLYKKRVANSSTKTGKSGGFRIIIYQKIENEIFLISIYSKTDKETIGDKELKELIREIITWFQTNTLLIDYYFKR